MIRVVLVALAVVAIAALPALGDNYLLRLGTMFAMYAVLAQSWNVIGGFAGYPSFATAAFFGLGAYSGAILQSAGLPMPDRHPSGIATSRPGPTRRRRISAPPRDPWLSVDSQRREARAPRRPRRDQNPVLQGG